MIKTIVRDELFLSRPSEAAVESDASVADDLIDTLAANADGCVGMAANMIGVAKRIIAFDNNGTYTVMFNPEIIASGAPFEAEEGCLSLTGTRKTKRFKMITVRYQDSDFEWKTQPFVGWTAQIIQHEIDHCNGIII